MGLKLIYFYFLCSFVAVNVIFADEAQQRASLPFPFLPFNFNQLKELPSLPFLGAFSRQTRDVSAQEAQEDADQSNGPQDRLFFPRLVTCNYTAQPGASCAGCRQALICLSSNVGIRRNCPLYCNNGHCSFIAGSACSASSTNSTG